MTDMCGIPGPGLEDYVDAAARRGVLLEDRTRAGLAVLLAVRPDLAAVGVGVLVEAATGGC